MSARKSTLMLLEERSQPTSSRKDLKWAASHKDATVAQLDRIQDQLMYALSGSQIVRAAAKNPAYPSGMIAHRLIPFTQGGFAGTGMPAALQSSVFGMLENPNCSPDVLRWWYESFAAGANRNVFPRLRQASFAAAAANPGCPLDVQQGIVRNEKAWRGNVMGPVERVAMTATDEALQCEIATHSATSVRCALARNPALTDAAQKVLLRKRTAKVLGELAAHGRFSENELEELAASPEGVRSSRCATGIAKGSACVSTLIGILSHEAQFPAKEAETKLTKIATRSTDVSEVSALCQSPNARVRAAAAGNPVCPEEYRVIAALLG